MDTILLALLAVLISLLLWLIRSTKNTYKYWEKQGVKSPKIIPPFGNMWPILSWKKSIAEWYSDAYLEFPEEKLVGMYEIMTPSVVPVDLDLIDCILVKDFHHFTDHPLLFDKESVFALGLFNLNGSYWKAVRWNVSPTFTAAKLKNMMPKMIVCVNSLIKKIKDQNGKDFEVKNVLATYSLDVIASTVFGIEFGEGEERRKFNDNATSIFTNDKITFLKIVFTVQAPNLARSLGFRYPPAEVEEYFKDIVKLTFHHRTSQKIQRNDYVQHLLHLKERIPDPIEEVANHTVSSVDFTDDLLTGQALQFLLAGHEPVYNVILFTMYELSKYPNIQERTRKEVKAVIQRHSGYSYEALKEMTLLKHCIQESLRLHPLSEFLMRLCTEDYVTQDGVTIKKGTKVVVPIKALHKDSRYYKDPETFNPDRFEKDVPKHYPAYLPFGNGPRICIGIHYAMLEIKLALAQILDNFKIELGEHMEEPLTMNKLAFLAVPKSKVYMSFKPL